MPKAVAISFFMLLLAVHFDIRANEAAIRHVDVRQQELASSLQAVAGVFDLQVAFHSEVADGLNGPPLRGDFTREQAFSKLLSQTDLEYEFISASSVVVRKKQFSDIRPQQQTLQQAPSQGASGAQSPRNPQSGSDSKSMGAPGLEEVRVTARRRDELLKDVPQQVSFFSASEIADAQIDSFQDFANLTPNFQSFENFRKGVFNISVRGIPTVQGGEAPVTVLLDGVQVAGLDFINQDLFDLAGIQILRGPQGAVYGRGAIGGTVIIDTNRPTSEFEGSAEASYTSEIDEIRVTGTLSGPILSENVQLRLAATHTDQNGFIKNSLAGGGCDFVEETSIRARLAAQITDQLSMDWKSTYLDGNNYASCMNFSTDADPFLGNGNNFPEDLPRDFKQFDDREIVTHSLVLDYVTDFGTLTSASSYQSSDSFSPGDVDFGPVIQPVFFENPVKVDAWNTDIHFVSDGEGPFSWVLGGFYQDRETKNFLVVGFGPPPIAPPFFVNSVQQDISEASALYGEVTFQPSKRSELSFAMRYDEDKRESADLTVPGSFIEETFTGWQPRATFSYDLSDNWMGYASIGTGFRSGGFNSLADTQAVGLSDRKFEKEEATTYEAGIKGVMLYGLLNLNAAVFHTDFDNQQFFFVDTLNFARVVIAFPNTVVNGAELDLTYNPFEGLSFNVGVGISDGEIEDGGEFAPDNVHSPNSHRYTANFTTQYVTPVSDTTSLRLRGEYERRGPIYYDFAEEFKFPATTFLNAYVALEWDRTSVSLFVRNLTDERMPTFFGVDSGGPGTHQFFQNLPRRFGVQFAASF